MKKIGTRFLVGFMMATMLAVAGRAQAMSFAPNTEGKNQFAPTMQTTATQFAPNAEGKNQFVPTMQTMETQFAQNTPAIKTAPTTSAKTMGGVEKKLGTEKTAGAGVGGKTAGGAGEKWKPDVFRLSLLPSLAYFSYEESVEGKPFMDIKGMVYGFESNLKININPSGFGFMLVPFDLAVYDGKQLIYTGGGNHSFDEGIFLFWVRGLAGPSITFLNHYRFNFLTGYGYKYTENTYTNGGALAYGLRTNKIDYIPLVLQFEYMGEHFSVLAHGEYDVFLAGVQTQEESTNATTINNYFLWAVPQTKGYGFRTAFELAYYGVTIAPFFNYFWIDRTQGMFYIIGEGGAAEPLNITKEFGIKIGYQF